MSQVGSGKQTKQAYGLILIVLMAMGFALFCTNDIVRKNDQAAMLAGAYELAQGNSPAWGEYYQYDKTFMLYWFCAGVFRLLPHADWAVFNANFISAAFYWVSLVGFVCARRRSLRLLPLICFLSAPAVLLNTLYSNSSLLSSAFLWLAVSFLLPPSRKSGRSWSALGGGVCIFLATGARLDILLSVPFLLWMLSDEPRGSLRLAVRDLLGSAPRWALIMGALAATALAVSLGGEGATSDLFFQWKMAAGYLVFGFGAAGVLFLVYAGVIFMRSSRVNGALERVYFLTGGLLFCLPLLFYLPQIHTPRYFWRACELMLIFGISRRGRALCADAWHRLAGSRSPAGLRAVLLVAALLPFCLGLQAPSLRRPRPTAVQPVLYPTGDGVYPMGAYFWFMLRMRNAQSNPLDHNQLIWNAIRDCAPLWEAEEVPVLWSPQFGSFKLAASLAGGSVECQRFDQLKSNLPFYADSRNLMRRDPKTPQLDREEILGYSSRFVSSQYSGVGILQIGCGSPAWGRKTALLNRIFQGDEYRVFSNPKLPFSKSLAGHKLILFGREPFPGSSSAPDSDYYFCQLQLPEGRERLDELIVRYNMPLAGSVFPTWMSLQEFE